MKLNNILVTAANTVERTTYFSCLQGTKIQDEKNQLNKQQIKATLKIFKEVFALKNSGLEITRITSSLKQNNPVTAGKETNIKTLMIVFVNEWNSSFKSVFHKYANRGIDTTIMAESKFLTTE